MLLTHDVKRALYVKQVHPNADVASCGNALYANPLVYANPVLQHVCPMYTAIQKPVRHARLPITQYTTISVIIWYGSLRCLPFKVHCPP